jgi:hypothetical protein
LRLHGNVEVAVGKFARLVGDVEVAAGNSGRLHGDVEVAAGKSSRFGGNVDVAAGNFGRLHGDVDVAVGNPCKLAGDVEVAVGNLERFAGNVDKTSKSFPAGRRRMLVPTPLPGLHVHPPLNPRPREAMQPMRTPARKLLFLLTSTLCATACGGLAEGTAGGDASDESLPRLPGARVFMALDPKGTKPITATTTDGANVYCIAQLPSPMPGATITFTIRETVSSTGSYAAQSATLMPGQTLAHFELPHVDPYPRGSPRYGMGDGPEAGYCDKNGAGCENGFADQGSDTCGAGLKSCAEPAGRAAFPYPEGTLACSVVAKDEFAGSAELRVAYPPTVDGQTCPAPVFEPGCGENDVRQSETVGLCQGWVPEGATCNGCTCSGMFWSCPP